MYFIVNLLELLTVYYFLKIFSHETNDQYYYFVLATIKENHEKEIKKRHVT